MANDKVINFMGLRYMAAVLSLCMIVLAIGSLAIRHLPFGLDFTGGVLIEVSYEQPIPLEEVRDHLSEIGYPNAVVQTYGQANEVLIRLAATHTPTLAEEIVSGLQSSTLQEITARRSEYVGAQVGEELREQGGLGMLLALGLVMLYVTFRFQLKFAVGAVIALLHDVLIVLGAYSLFQWQFDLTVLAALLAVIGYSLNDTLVVADRIRENFRKIRKAEPVGVINASLTQTLGRTLITSLTTLMVLFALFLFGGEMLHGFSTALIIGVAVGTYSSIYVASSMLLWLKLTREDLVITEDQQALEDQMP